MFVPIDGFDYFQSTYFFDSISNVIIANCLSYVYINYDSATTTAASECRINWYNNRKRKKERRATEHVFLITDRAHSVLPNVQPFGHEIWVTIAMPSVRISHK